MDIIDTMKEIGIIETALNLATIGSRNSAIEKKVLPDAPFPPVDISQYIELITDWISGFGKKKFFFFTPELALIESLARKTTNAESFVAIPSDLDSDIEKNIKNNLPNSMKVSILNEPFFPPDFRPGNGIIIVCGWMNGKRLYVFKDTYRLIKHYSEFKGKKIFVPYVMKNGAYVSDNWIEVDGRFFTLNWRNILCEIQ